MLKQFILFSTASLCLLSNSFATVQQDKLWVAVNAQHRFSGDKRWLGFLYTQFRFYDETYHWQSGFIEGGIGYRFIPDASIWLGYRFTGQNPYNGFSQQNRLFQQVIWQTHPSKNDLIIFRSRLEEIQHSNQHQIALRFRQRAAVELRKSFIFEKLYPFIYDEVFIQLNKTNYTTSKFISQNRLFIGFNLYIKPETWWEIGYMNQLEMHPPTRTQNLIGHILTLTYNFWG